MIREFIAAAKVHLKTWKPVLRPCLSGAGTASVLDGILPRFLMARIVRQNDTLWPTTKFGVTLLQI